MSQPKLEAENVTIVLLGSFNPQIFQPAWFASQGLIRKEAADSTKIEVIHNEIASLSIESLKLQITKDRYFASTPDASSYEVLRDLTLGSFRILHHTPISAMGLNHGFHYLMPSEDAWHEVGIGIAPPGPWSKILQKPVLRSLTMQGARPDKYKGYIQVHVEPSSQVKPGVFVTFNDHYEHKVDQPAQGCDEIINILNSNFTSFLDFSRKMAFSLIGVR